MILRHQASEVAASTPPITIAGMSLWGYPLADWVQLLAALWLVVQLGYFVWTKFIRKEQKGD